MTEKPIIFTGEMVRAIFEGRKTQTRRVIKKWIGGCSPPQMAEYCLYGQVGDKLWVRETVYETILGDWKYKADTSEMKEGDISKDEYFDSDDMSPRPSIFMPRWASRILLEITEIGVERLQEITFEDAIAEGMPNAGNFDEEDFDKAGVTERTYTDAQGRRCHCFGAKAEFANLWDSLNAKRGYGWDKNPWVWMITFKKVDNG